MCVITCKRYIELIVSQLQYRYFIIREYYELINPGSQHNIVWKSIPHNQ